MKIILFSRAQIAHTPEEIRQLIGTIGAFGFDYAATEATERCSKGCTVSAARRFP